MGAGEGAWRPGELMSRRTPVGTRQSPWRPLPLNPQRPPPPPPASVVCGALMYAPPDRRAEVR